MKLVIVESPAKSKTISKYLGSGYKITASFGHIRDLPSKDGSVDPTKNFEMNYQIKEGATKTVNAIISEAKKADMIYMASDPDREGEAIAWNIAEILAEKKVNVPIKRAAFSEITANAVKDAIKNARDIDYNLVDAQQTRLSLDYLVGFTVSPVLWQKLSGIKSAGRVQSVALRLIVERELEIRAFIPSEYWTIDFNVSQKKNIIPVKVIEYEGKKISNKFPKNEDEAKKIVTFVENTPILKVINVESKDVKRNPFPPFNTSSLQQDASNKLGFPADKTMKIAQKLYEGVDVNGETFGLITYMRTDGTTISDDALTNIRKYIKDAFGNDYLPSKSRIYKTKTKNAQEAHEAIRPTDITLSPTNIKNCLSAEELKLYDLIWKRTLACQMKEAIFLRQSIDFADVKNIVITRANGSIIKFDGFLKIYDVNYASEEDGDGLLPVINVGDEVNVEKPINSKQHFTSPKPRYTEASLVKELEEMGIGRPSTYVTIIKILQDRDYVSIDKRQFHPSVNGVIVIAFLKVFFTQYVEYDFTAKLEEELDLISDGKFTRIEFLTKFWQKFHQSAEDALKIERMSVSEKISELVDSYIFSGKFVAQRKCLSCGSEKIAVKIGKFGAYVQCNDCSTNIAIDKYLGENMKNTGSPENPVNLDGLMGVDSIGNKIFKKTGRFGDYVEQQSESGVSIKRSSIPKFIEDLNLETAIKLLSLPKEIGENDGEKITVGIGKFGPYLLYSGKYYTLSKDPGFLDIATPEAIEIIANAPKSDGKTKKTYVKKTTEIGVHPDTGKPILIGKSAYGVYALYNKKFHTIKSVDEIADVTLEIALNAIEK